MSILIREATPADFPSVLSLVKELAVFQQALDKVTITIEQMIAAQGQFHCLVAENNNKEIVGIATYFFGYFTWVGKSLWLDDLYVKPSERGKNAGRQLLNKIFDIAREQNCQRVRWQVSDWNKKAIEFYRNCGAAIDTEVYNCDFTRDQIETFTC